MRVSVLNTGTEILLGDVINTHLSFIARVAPYAGSAMSIWICTEASGQELLWASISLVVGLAIRALTLKTLR